MTSPADAAFQAMDQRITAMDANITTALGIANQSMTDFQRMDNELRGRLDTVVSDTNDRVSKTQFQMDQIAQQVVTDSATMATLQTKLDQMQIAMDQMAVAMTNQQNSIDKLKENASSLILLQWMFFCS